MQEQGRRRWKDLKEPFPESIHRDRRIDSHCGVTRAHCFFLTVTATRQADPLSSCAEKNDLSPAIGKIFFHLCKMGRREAYLSAMLSLGDGALSVRGFEGAIVPDIEVFSQVLNGFEVFSQLLLFLFCRFPFVDNSLLYMVCIAVTMWFDLMCCSRTIVWSSDLSSWRF